jgi:hypothetical protein
VIFWSFFLIAQGLGQAMTYAGGAAVLQSR